VQSGRLLFGDLRPHLMLRIVLGATALYAASQQFPIAAIALATAAEITGRYLFFVSVVPRNMAASFFPGAREAA
jgi:hypothetical protein